MEVVSLFAVIGITIFVGFIADWIFEKTRIPDAVWLIFLGVAIGYMLDLSNSTVLGQIAPAFTTFALIFILFEGVLNTDLKKLLAGVMTGSSLSFVNFILSIVFVSGTMVFLGWSVLEGMLLGAILGDASQAVIIPLIKKIQIKPQASLVLTFESAISDVLCIVGAVTLINIISMDSFHIMDVVQKIIYSFSISLFFGFIGGYAWIHIHKIMDKFSKSFMTTIAALLMIYSFVEWMGASGALACLAFGIVVGSSKKILSIFEHNESYSLSPSAKFFFSEISFFVKTFFFLYLGIIINLHEIRLILMGLGLAILLFIVRTLSVRISYMKSKIDEKDRTFLEVLNPKGLSAAVLAQLPAQYNLPHGKEFSTIVLTAIIASVFISLIFVYFTDKGSYKGLLSLFRSAREGAEKIYLAPIKK